MKRFIFILALYFNLICNLLGVNTNSSLVFDINIYNSSEYLFDNLDSHMWWSETWFDTITSLSYENFNGRDCFRTDNTLTNINGLGGLLRTDWYYPTEDWEGFISLKCDYFLLQNQTTITLVLEVYTNHDKKLEEIRSDALVYNSWQEVDWTFTGSLDYSYVRGLRIRICGLKTNELSTIYLDRMRLCSAISEQIWDDFDDSTYKWKFTSFSDAVRYPYAPWMDACEPITHNQLENPTNNAGCLFMEWDSSVQAGADYAQMENQFEFNADCSGFDQISFRVRCDSASVRFYLGFNDGDGDALSSSETNVQTADTWETIFLDLPEDSNFNWDHLDKIRWVVNTDVVNTGTLYIDEIKFIIK